MFTGIIETLGTVAGLKPLAIHTPFKKLAKGESVAVNGVCLTVLSRKAGKKGTDFTAELSEETLRKTALGALATGDKVNLERSLKVGDRISGHFVLGHADGTGKIVEARPESHSKMFWFTLPKDLEAFILPKGSVAVDGISLTVVEVKAGRFSVSVLPYTEQETTLGQKKPGDAVNLEVDILVKAAITQVQNILGKGGSLPQSDMDNLFQKIELKWRAEDR